MVHPCSQLCGWRASVSDLLAPVGSGKDLSHFLSATHLPHVQLRKLTCCCGSDKDKEEGRDLKSKVRGHLVNKQKPQANKKIRSCQLSPLPRRRGVFVPPSGISRRLLRPRFAGKITHEDSQTPVSRARGPLPVNAHGVIRSLPARP